MNKQIEIPNPILWSNKCRKWFTFCGYDTYTQELCRIFGVQRSTFGHRVESGWPMEAVVTAESEGGWNINNAFLLADDVDVQHYCQSKMDEYFEQKALYIRVAVEHAPGKNMPLPSKVEQFAAQQAKRKR